MTITDGATRPTPFRTAVVLTSTGPAYADPWHDLTGVAASIAGLLTEVGLQVEVRDDVAAALDDHAGRSLVVVSVSGATEGPGREQEEAEADRVDAALGRHVAAGAPVLAVHAGGMAFPAVPGWHGLLGARWVHGRSGHPDLGWCTVQVDRSAHPVTAGLADLTVEDERYSDLDVLPDRQALVTHEHDGRTHPLVLVGTVGGSRVVYDALGHDGRSYAAEGRRELLRREARWAAGLPPVG